ncbi:MAG TPA: beta-1,3-glucanase family protein [Spirochaetota bacterium]|nr:beta-1,3-glucanase family protein [Spirochaetota bacterium]HNT10954.1 beta-1,3-glucanase family protein [Spirochaetota bacterium]
MKKNSVLSIFGVLLLLGCIVACSSSKGGSEGGGGGSNGGGGGSKDGPFDTFITCEFVNSTSGGETYGNYKIWVTAYSKDESGAFFSIDLNDDGVGSRVYAKAANQQLISRNLEYISARGGLKLPAYTNGARLYISYGDSAIFIQYVDTPDGLGVQGPAIANGEWGTKIWDFIEFAAVKPDGVDFNVNTSTVDSFCIPIELELRNASGTSLGTRGITASRSAVFSKWEASTMPDAFKKLVYKDGDTYIRIISPGPIATAASISADGDFKYLKDYLGGTLLVDYQTTLKEFLNGTLNTMWTSHTSFGTGLSFVDEGTTYTCWADGNLWRYTTNGNVTSDAFGKPIDGTDSSSIWGCSGNLQPINGEDEKNKVKKFLAAAFNRGMVANGWDDTDGSKYYKPDGSGGVYNHYSKFFHRTDVSPDGKAYGFSFDDVHDKNSSIGNASTKKMIITVR